MNIIRGSSAGLTLAESKSGKSHWQNIKDVLLYMFYVPLFFTGPLLNFDDFIQQVRPIILIKKTTVAEIGPNNT
jgi:D-alanyl-lipoteichoic acid acyltransferase DltB (MBOAT superfamily)